ncbi:MAG: histidine phosphatase family protein, partial [Acutalibacteraceae bacterium]
MKSYYIHFISHGDIAETLSGKYIGTTDVPLSDKGIENLKKYDKEYKYPYGQAIFTSPLKRCLQTCEIIYPSQKPIIIDALSECNFGKWENMSADELKDDEDFKKWVGGSPEVRPPRGESSSDFTRRICRAFEDIVTGLLKTGTTETVIVTHAGVIMTLLSVYGLPSAKPFQWVMDSGFGYSMRITPMLWQRD